MLRRTLSEELITALTGNPAWKNLLADTSLFPEIRDGHVTVYHLGGAFLRGLRLDNGGLCADIHPKYIPVTSAKASVPLSWTSQGFGFSDDATALPLGEAGSKELKAYKDRMRLVLTDFPEGAVVQAILERPENCILDQEITFQASGQPRDKIDLCYFDAGLQKLVFVEVKRRVDSRLWKPTEQPEIISQLRAYGDQLRNLRSNILEAYREVVSIKQSLGLGRRLSAIPAGGPADLLEKPLLVIGDCSLADVQAMNSGSPEWQTLLKGLPDVAAGLILCGSDGCRLTLDPAGRQTRVFK
ncbi:hypothetical protein BH11PLA2_BH11PLA2_38430 [soil metagenome]